MNVLTPRQAAALVAANPGVAVSLGGVIATIRTLTYCGHCRSEVAEPHPRHLVGGCPVILAPFADLVRRSLTADDYPWITPDPDPSPAQGDVSSLPPLRMRATRTTDREHGSE